MTGGIISGLKYIQVAKRAGLQVDKMEEMVGSYGPSEAPVVKRFAAEEAPSGEELSLPGARYISRAAADSWVRLRPYAPGMLARGSYAVRSRCVDDDGT